jgi:hypothetical protein
VVKSSPSSPAPSMVAVAVPGGGRRGLGFWLSGDGSGAHLWVCVFVWELENGLGERSLVE